MENKSTSSQSHSIHFGQDGHIYARNPSAFWLPEFTLHREIGGTVYSVSGTYEGVEPLDKKLMRVLSEALRSGEVRG